MTPTIQTVYLPAKVEEASGNYIPDKSVLLVKEQDEMDKHWIDLVHQKQGYFFTPEQLNEYTFNVIKQALEDNKEKKWTDEDVIRIVEKSRETGLTAEYIILTLQPKTEWNVEIIEGKLKLV